MSDWQTDISTYRDGERHTIRGQALDDLIRDRSFVDVIFLLVRGDLPNEAETKMLEAMLVAMCEHGPDSPSTAVTMTVTSTGNKLNAALASGLLTMGSRHGGAVTAAMEMFTQDRSASEIVQRATAEKRRLPGLGHKVYKEEDPRTKALFEKAEELGLSGEFVRRAREIETALKEEKGRLFPLNIDGSVAALLLELKIPISAGNAMFMLGRMPGLIAHAIEEQSRRTYRRK